MFWSIYLLMLALFGALALFTQSAAAMGLLTIVVLVGLLLRVGLWRTMLVVSISTSVLRSSVFGGAMPESIWYALQFGPIVIAAVLGLFEARPRLRPSDHLVIGFLFLFNSAAFLSSFFSKYSTESFAQAGILILFTFFLSTAYTRRWRDMTTLNSDLRVLFVTLVVIQFVGLLGALFSDWAFDVDYGRYTGLFSNSNYAGLVSAMGVALGIYFLRGSRYQIAVLVSIVILVIGLIMSGSRGSLLAVIIGALFALFSQINRSTIFRLFLFISVAGVVFVVLKPEALSDFFSSFVRTSGYDVSSGRLDIFRSVLEVFENSPIVGSGFRTTELIQEGLTAHNLYLSVLAETGLLGAVMFFGLVLSVVAAGRRPGAPNPLLPALVTVGAMELTESSIFGFGGPTATTAWLLVLAFSSYGRLVAEKLDKSNVLDSGAKTSLNRAEQTRCGATHG